MKDKINQNDKVNIVNQEYKEEISKETLAKGMIAGALAVGAVGSMEALKPSTASAATEVSQATNNQINNNILAVAKQKFGPNAEIREIVNGRISEKFIYIKIGEPKDVFKCTAVYPAISDGATSQVRVEDKTSYGTELKVGSELSTKVGLDRSLGSDILKGFQSAFNFSFSASASGNASYTRQYSTLHNIDKTITAPTQLGQSVIPTVFEHQSSQKIKLQRVNPAYVQYMVEQQHKYLNGPNKPPMFVGNPVDQTLTYVDGKYFIGIERKSPIGNQIAFGGGIQGQEFQASQIEASKQKQNS